MLRTLKRIFSRRDQAYRRTEEDKAAEDDKLEFIERMREARRRLDALEADRDVQGRRFIFERRRHRHESS